MELVVQIVWEIRQDIIIIQKDIMPGLRDSRLVSLLHHAKLYVWQDFAYVTRPSLALAVCDVTAERHGIYIYVCESFFKRARRDLINHLRVVERFVLSL